MDQRSDIFRLRAPVRGKESHLAPVLSLHSVPRGGVTRTNGKVAPHDGAAVAQGLGWDVLKQYDQALKSLLAELSTVREEERRKLADDLHDHVGQNLALARMKLGMLETSVPDEYTAAVQEVCKLVGEAINDARSLINDRHPQSLRDLGLKARIDRLVEEMQSRYDLSCVAEIAPVPKSLGQDAQAILFQAARELLINVAKHAGARQARVSLQTEDGWVTIHVVDNGRGFDPTRAILPESKVAGFGLFSVRERIARLGGDLHIDSSPGRGTRVEVRLPINNNLENHKNPENHK